MRTHPQPHPLHVPAPQFAGHALYRFRLWQCKNLPLPTLSVVCHLDALPLAQLVGTLQPAGAAPCAFQRLELVGSLPGPGSLAACTQLSQLRELQLVNTYAPAGSNALEQVLAALLQQASRLCSLALNCPDTRAAKLRAVPACLASYRGLTSLSLVGQALDDLPPGEYLQGGWLRAWKVGGCGLGPTNRACLPCGPSCAALPPAEAAHTADCSRRQLRCSGCKYVGLLNCRFEAATLPPAPYTGLSSLDISGNAFARLPPVLSSATTLTRLTIDEDTASGLCSCEASLAMLRTLPRLQGLEVGHIAAAGPASHFDDLQARLPNLSVVATPADRLE